MSSEAARVRVLGGDVGRAGGVKGLDVEERVGLGSVKATQHDVWAVLQACAWSGHELLEATAAAWPLGVHVRRPEQGVKANDPRVDGRIMARAGQAYAMPAWAAPVAVERTVLFV